MQKTSMLINERFFALMLKHSAFTPTRSGPKEETLSTEQEQWAAQTREIPAVFRIALLRDDDAIRHRPAAGEWSAVEVVGHMIDKMQIWTSRVERLMVEERPALPRYDQDALVRDHDYLHADPEVLFEHLRQACERFATLVEHIPISIREIEPCYIRYQSPRDRSSTDYQPVSRRKKGDLLCQHR